jgi:hypothetical protein
MKAINALISSADAGLNQFKMKRSHARVGKCDAICNKSGEWSDLKSSKTLEIYTHVSQKSIQQIRSPFDDL